MDVIEINPQLWRVERDGAVVGYVAEVRGRFGDLRWRAHRIGTRRLLGVKVCESWQRDEAIAAL
ncbi:hypothetical protein [Pseudoclavibacter soli]|uniref:hypothetical protein n=1 Tax=Pseudoclavibacter soli TaxID=452623 RepID=UPI0003FE46B6|nr:hypothetical protein [Pseudoclavibacter soli]